MYTEGTTNCLQQHMRSQHEPIISSEDITNQVSQPHPLLQRHPSMKSNFLMSKLHYGTYFYSNFYATLRLHNRGYFQSTNRHFDSTTEDTSSRQSKHFNSTPGILPVDKQTLRLYNRGYFQSTKQTLRLYNRGYLQSTEQILLPCTGNFLRRIRDTLLHDDFP